MSNLKAWFWAHKGYIIHGVAVAVVFLNPSVKDFVAQFATSHPTDALVVSAVYGWLLHWATGK